MSHRQNPSTKPNSRIQKGAHSPKWALWALLDSTFLRYCAVGALASGVFYGVANFSALLLKVDSMDSYSASAECMDSKEAALRLLCHTANTARNDKNNPNKKVDSRSETQNLESTFENAQNVGKPAQDSNAFTQNAQNLETPQAVGFCDDFLKKPTAASPCTAAAGFVGCQGGGEGIYLSGNEQALAADSRKNAQKPTPEPSQILATLLGSLASFIFGYFAQMRLAFRAYPNHSTMLPRYLALLATIAIYAQVITYLSAFLALSYYLISAFIALSVPLFSYPLQKLWVFAKTSKGGGGD